MLSLRNIDAGYGTYQALFGVSLEVNAGEAIGVIGGFSLAPVQRLSGVVLFIGLEGKPCNGG